MTNVALDILLYWIFSNHLHSYCIHCKRRGMQQCHVFLNCCYVEKMTLMGFQKKSLDGAVGGVRSIQVFFGFLVEFF